jgi:hypothetical protein
MMINIILLIHHKIEMIQNRNHIMSKAKTNNEKMLNSKDYLVKRSHEIPTLWLEMCKVVPGPNFFWLGPAPKFFLNRIRTKCFFLDRDRDQNIFDWDRHQSLFLKGPGSKSKTFFRRNRDQNFFLPGPGPKMTGPAHVYLWQIEAYIISLILLICKTK